MRRHFGGLLLVFGMLSYWLLPFLSYILIAAGLVAVIYQIWKDPEYGLYLTIFFLPLTKTLNLPIVGTKLGIPDFLFVTTFLTYLISKKVGLKLLFKEKYLVPWFAFLAVSLISGIKAISVISWFIEFLTYLYLTLFFVFFISVLDKKKLEKAIQVLIFSLSFVILFGILGYIMILFEVQNNPFAFYYRITSVFKSVNQLSMTLLLGFFLMLDKAEKDSKLLLICILGSFVFLASGTRIVPIVLLPFILFYCLYKIFSKEKAWAGLVVFAVVLLLVFGPIDMIKPEGVQRSIGAKKSVEEILPNTELSIEKILGENNNNFVLEFVKRADITRYYQLVAFIGMFRDNPLLGVGAANFIHQMPNYIDHTTYWEMHNTFLGVLAEEGILGLLFLVAFLGSIAFLAMKKLLIKKNYKIVMISLGILSMLTYCMVHFGLRNRHFWLVLAFLIILTKK